MGFSRDSALARLYKKRTTWYREYTLQTDTFLLTDRFSTPSYKNDEPEQTSLIQYYYCTWDFPVSQWLSI